MLNSRSLLLRLLLHGYGCCCTVWPKCLRTVNASRLRQILTSFIITLLTIELILNWYMEELTLDPYFYTRESYTILYTNRFTTLISYAETLIFFFFLQKIIILCGVWDAQVHLEAKALLGSFANKFVLI